MTQSKLSHWCNGIMEAGWLLAIMGAPLFFNIHSSRVFEPDKLTLVRSLALIMVGAWLVRFIDQQEWRNFSSWFDWRSKSSLWHKPFALFAAILVLVYFLSSLFSVTSYVSWLGSYQRLQGTYTTFSYIIIFVIMASTIRTRVQLQRVITMAIVVSIPVSLYAMLQHFSLDPLPWGGNTQTRVAGHMGNSIFVAAYLIMIVPLTLARILDAFTNILEDEDLAVSDIVRSSIYIFTLAIQLIAIFWTQSRGPWVGLGIALFIFMLIVLVNLRKADEDRSPFRVSEGLLAFGGVVFGGGVLLAILYFAISALSASDRFLMLSGATGSFAAFAGSIVIILLAIVVFMFARVGWRWLWLSWITIALILGIWVGVFNFTTELEETMADTPVAPMLSALDEWKSISGVGRLGRIFESEGGSGRVRVLIWQGALELIAPHEPIKYPDGTSDTFNFLRPLLGYGPESMYVAYNKFYPPELATVEARNASPDRSHNETIDALVITGGLGFLAWQLLYLSLFYYGFKWLGILQTKRDQVMLIALWFGGAIVSGLIFTSLFSMEFIGVALPFGSMMGLIIYLIYYALFLRTTVDEESTEPFNADQLMLIGLISAIIAHYIEIHFGIAIASTRVHFFAYLALVFLLGYLLPQLNESFAVKVPASEIKEEVAPEPIIEKPNRRRRRGSSTSVPKTVNRGWLSHLLIPAFMLSVMIGILSYDFTTYSLPPGESIESLADVPSASAILAQSFFVNAADGFKDSPYIYLTIVLTWVLGALLFLSELVKDGVIHLTVSTDVLKVQKRQIILGLFGGWGALSVILYFTVYRGTDVSSVVLLGRNLLLLWGIVNVGALLVAVTSEESTVQVAGIIGATAIVMFLPVLIAQAGLIALALGLTGGFLIYLLWDSSLEKLVYPVLALYVTSFVVGIAYAWIHARQLRATFIGVAETDLIARRIAEADQAAGILTTFYGFVIVVLFIISLILAFPKMESTRYSGHISAAVSGFVIFVLVLFVAIPFTNLRIIYADITYKRATPWEQQANRARNQGSTEQAASFWEQVVGIYEHAVDLAPAEDFYYLFLGRAYLESSAIYPSASAEQIKLLETAESRLKDAQKLNPLNTDHTANLARLSTRWAGVLQADERETKYEEAENYYRRATDLSPQNAVIRNEYARLPYAFHQDCAESIARYETSREIDPYYINTLFEMSDVEKACGDIAESEEDKITYYQGAASNLEEGLTMPVTGRQSGAQNNPQRWLQLGRLHELLEDFDQALTAYERALPVANNSVPAWQIYREIGRFYVRQDDIELAVNALSNALSEAPNEQKPSIQQEIVQITNQTSNNDANINSGERVLLTSERPLAGMEPAARNGYYAGNTPPTVIDFSKTYEVVMVTEKGEVRLRLFDDKAPLTVNNFVFLASEGFYDGVPFHRVLAGFMAQGGDPTGTGTGGPGYLFQDETQNGLIFDRPGLLAMANSGANTNGSQFFITFGIPDWLNGQHTIFGEVVEGQQVLNSLTLRDPEQPDQPEGDKILRMDIYEIQ